MESKIKKSSKNDDNLTGHILLVDDDIGLLELLVMFLESIGHQVTAHADPEDAIRDLPNTPFDLVISDLRMGPLDGMSLLNTIQELDQPPPVIIITAHGCIPSAVDAMRNGAFHYLTKPFTNIVSALQGNQMPDPVYSSSIYSQVSPKYAISMASVYRLKNNKITTVSGGDSAKKASKKICLKESKYAAGWYKATTADVFAR